MSPPLLHCSYPVPRLLYTHSPPNCWVVVAGVSVLVCWRSCLVAACAARMSEPTTFTGASQHLCTIGWNDTAVCGAPIADTGDGAEACSASAEAQFAFEEVLALQVCEDETLIFKHPLALIQRLSRISHMLARSLSMRETYCVRTSLSSE